MPRARNSRLQPPTFSAATAPSHLFAGTSGWAYSTWKPAFYPEKLAARDFLAFYASQFPSVEVNYTFTKLPTPEQTAAWLAATPPGFRFTFKAPQRVTHMSRLSDTAAAPLAEFLLSLKPLAKAGRLGAILFQLPPNFKSTPDTQQRLAAFLRLPGLRRFAGPLAFEFRHASWFTDQTYATLQQRAAALCIADTDDLITPEVFPAAHTYFRFRRSGGYSAAKLRSMAQHLVGLTAQREVFAYFRHEDQPTGALNARAFLRSANRLAAAERAA